MEIELIEIGEFLGRYRPFSILPQEALKALVFHVEVAYFRAGTMILNLNDETHDLYVIRSGAVELHRSNGELYNRYGEGNCFGQFALLRNRRVRYPVKAIEDTLVYLIAEAQFHDLCERYDEFADHMEEDHACRLRNAVELFPAIRAGTRRQTPPHLRS